MEEQIRIFTKRTATKSFVKRKIDRTYLNTFNIQLVVKTQRKILADYKNNFIHQMIFK